MFIPHELYVKILPERFYEVVPYNSTSQSLDVIVNALIRMPITSPIYSFTRLNKHELMDYISMFHSIRVSNKYYMAQFAERIYHYNAANLINSHVTPSVASLIHLTHNDPHLPYQISVDEFEKMNSYELNKLTKIFYISDVDNYRDELLRLLRIGLYLRIE